MNCTTHPDLPAAAYCRTCGKALCDNCQRDVKGVIYCEDCIAARVLGTALPATPGIAQPGSTPKVEGAPNPVAATLLGFIPGVGAMYNGQWIKSLVHIGIFAFLIWIANHADILGIVVAFFYFYMVVDAYKTAHAMEMGQPLPDLLGIDSNLTQPLSNAIRSDRPAGAITPPTTTAGVVPASELPTTPVQHGSRGPIGAIILIAIGVLFLLDNLKLFHFFWFGMWWPVILIVIGGWLFTKRRSECPCTRCRCRGLMGPAVLVTIGVLFLLGSVTHERISFGMTWPALLVVIGAILILRSNASTEGHMETTPMPPPTSGTENQPPKTNDEVSNV